MYILRIQWLLYFAMIIISCNSSSTDVNIPDEKECSLSYFDVTSINSESSQESTIDVSAIIEANLKVIKSINLELGLDEAKYSKLNKESLKKSRNYTVSFLETHNSIINVLCSIENDLSNQLIDSTIISKLRLDYIDKRSRYFDLLLTINDNSTTSVLNTPSSNIVKEEEVLVSVYFNKNEFDISSLMVNDVPVSFVGSITEINGKFYVKEKAFTLSAKRLNGDVCSQKITVKSDTNKEIINFKAC